MAVSSLFLSGAAVVIPFLVSGSAAASSYTLDTEYSGSSFFDGFQFFTDPDPAQGFVSYVDFSTATAAGYISSSDNGPAYIGVDHTSVLGGSGVGRESVRIQTSKTFTHGLFILDASNMPGGACGTWPAWWSYGPNWPNSGEIDIIEGVNSGTKDKMSLHTSSNCTVTGLGQTGTLDAANCADGGVGCGTDSNTPNSYGLGFNANGGGVYATEWTDQYIKTWFFPRNSIPTDITNGSPDPSGWGLPDANFAGGCDIDSHFSLHQLVLNTDFCAPVWAGNPAVWAADATCSALAPSCVEYVQLNPSAFEDMYWEINYIKVYNVAGTTIEGPTHTSAAVPTATPSSIADLPTCGQTCFNAMIGQAPSLGCPTADPACLCQVTNFQNGMHDCSIAACGSAIGAYVLAFEAQWCAAALATAIISSSTPTATSPGSTPTSISTLPQCGQTCFSNMLAQASTLGCPTADPACLCQVTNFQNGMHDCSIGACGATVGAVVLAFEAQWCAAAAPSSAPTTTSVISTPTSISSLPACGQTCFNSMIGQASALGCPGADPACLCQNVNFQNGMHDCSLGACGDTIGATVLAFEAQWCAAATASLTQTSTATSPISTPTSVSMLPDCGQTCWNNMLGQANSLSCPTSDPACMCANPNFGNGIRDCSNAVCGIQVASTVIAFESAWCSSATATPTSMGLTSTAPNGPPSSSSAIITPITSTPVFPTSVPSTSATSSPGSVPTSSAVDISIPSTPSSTNSPTTSFISAPSSTSTSSPAAPTSVGGTFNYVGCFSSPDNFSSFHLQASNNDMTLDSCVFQCATVPDKYAGVWGAECYCSDAFNVTDIVLVPDGSCNTPCPGDASETCGGTIAETTLAKRQAGGKLLTVYVNNGTASNSTSTSSSSSSSSPAGPTSLAPSASSSTSPPLSSSTSTRVLYPVTNGTSTPFPTSTRILYPITNGTSTPFPTSTSILYPITNNTLTPFPSSPAQTTSYTLSTVYATSIYTITSCAPTVTDCPAKIGQLTTDIISLYTTICPVTATAAQSPPTPSISSKTQPIAYTTVVVTEYTAICPEGTLSVYTTSQTQTLYSVPGIAYTTTPAIAMTTVKTTLAGGSSVVLTVPAQATGTAPGGNESSTPAPPEAPVSSPKYAAGNSTVLVTGSVKVTASATAMVASGGNLGVGLGNGVVAFALGLVGLLVL